MEVIGAGFARTGTLSLKAALEQLGFGPCYHMLELIGHPEHAPLWQPAADGGIADWDRIFAGYRAAVDWPTCYFWRELTEAYPQARVILTVRDSQAWFASHAELFRLMLKLHEEQPAKAPAPEVFSIVGQILIGATFEGRLDDREHCIEVFERHNERVREGLAADRLLVFDVREGWEPLCAFLGVKVPDGPFPHLNEGARIIDNVQAVVTGSKVSGRDPS